jgi:imidazole glycerol-phosphate synthase subunit HisH
MIHVVDYGLGNVGAFLTLYDRLEIDACAAKTPDALAEASHIVLPGVGSFDHAMELLDRSGMRDVLDDKVLRDKAPVLGVCVGMQILGTASDEGISPGLGWIDGQIRSLATRRPNANLPLPQMGWNDVIPTSDLPLLAGIEDPRYYFLHSYYFDNSDPAHCVARVDYGGEFTCIVNRENIWGVQFHPEKSHHFGQGLLKNFAEL